MAIAFRTSASGYSTAATSQTLTVPGTVQAGDMMLLQLAAGNQISRVTAAATAGGDPWVRLRADFTAIVSSLWARTATAADAGSSITVTLSSATTCQTMLLAFTPSTVASSPAVISGAPTSNRVMSVTGTTAQAGGALVYLGVTSSVASAPTLAHGTVAVNRLDAAWAGVAGYDLATIATSGANTFTTAVVSFSSFEVVTLAPMPAAGNFTSGVAAGLRGQSTRIIKGYPTAASDDAAGA